LAATKSACQRAGTIQRTTLRWQLRRITRITYLIYELLYDEKNAITEDVAKRYTRLWQVLNQQTAFYEILRSAMEGLIDDAAIPWEAVKDVEKVDETVDQVWNSVRDAFQNLLDETAEPAQYIQAPHLQQIAGGTVDWLPSASLDQFNKLIRTRYDEISRQITSGSLKSADNTSPATLLARLDKYEESLVNHFAAENDQVREAYARFSNLDTYLFPLEMVGDLHEKDIIETVRISPRDAKKGFSSISDKVTGTMAYHFGAFFKRSWRSNDILWGRLDGLCQLIETLLEKDRLQQIVEDDRGRSRLSDRLFTSSSSATTKTWNPALDPGNLFPKAGSVRKPSCGIGSKI
jgi:Protein of unknown function (DUF3376)